jgi:predicted nucleic acid-binding protein
VEFHPEPRSIETAFRQATARVSDQPAAKAIGDSYLLAFAREAGATLVTFDEALRRHAGSGAVVVPVAAPG